MSRRFPVPPLGFLAYGRERTEISSWDAPQQGGVQCGAYNVARGNYAGFTTPGGGLWSLVSAEFEWTSVPDGTVMSVYCVEDDGSGNSPIEPSISTTPNYTVDGNPLTFAVGEEAYTWTDCILQPGAKYYLGFSFNGGGRGFLETTSPVSGLVSAVSTSPTTEFFWEMTDGQNMSGNIFRTKITLDPV